MRKRLAIALCAIAPLAIAACGGDDSSEPATDTTEDVNPAAEAIEFSAVPSGEFAYEQKSLETTPGQLTVTFDNPAAIAHNVCIEDAEGSELGCTDLVADGNTDVAQFELEPGEYTFYCSVAGHREGGMEGPLTVE